MSPRFDAKFEAGDILPEKPTCSIGDTSWNGWFSIVMLVLEWVHSPKPIILGIYVKCLGWFQTFIANFVPSRNDRTKFPNLRCFVSSNGWFNHLLFLYFTVPIIQIEPFGLRNVLKTDRTDFFQPSVSQIFKHHSTPTTYGPFCISRQIKANSAPKKVVIVTWVLRQKSCPCSPQIQHSDTQNDTIFGSRRYISQTPSFVAIHLNFQELS